MTTRPEGACCPIIFIDVSTYRFPNHRITRDLSDAVQGVINRWIWLVINTEAWIATSYRSHASPRQSIQQEPIIVFLEEAKVSMIATLNNMTGYAWQIHPWFYWHQNFLFPYQYRFSWVYKIFLLLWVILMYLLPFKSLSVQSARSHTDTKSNQA